MRVNLLFLTIVLAISMPIFAQENQKLATEAMKPQATLQEVARSERQWTGIAVANDGRIFVNYPRWGAAVPFSVGCISPSGEVSPFPDLKWNEWQTGMPAEEHFVCVQSVVMDNLGFLWIVDAGNPEFKGVIAGAPKLLKINLVTNAVQRIPFGSHLLTKNSYLNDVRIDTRAGYAYLSDSGAGAILVVNTQIGTAMRRLADHPSTKSEDIVLTVGGKPWLLNGTPPRVHVDGIAFDRDGGYLYYQALTGRTLYRIPTSRLNYSSWSEKLDQQVERVGETCAADGMEFGRDGLLYLTSLEESAIKSFRPGAAVETIVQSDDLAWPDSLAFGPDNSLYVTTSQIHLGNKRTAPYKIFKILRK
jgi:hypothetical protein